MTENNNSNPLESAFERMRSFVAGTCSRSLSTKSIQVLCVDTVFAGKRRIEVGQPLDPYIAHTLQERIVAIFATEALDQFLVCTTHRGAWRDMPYIFGKQEVTNLQESTNTEKQAQVLAHAGISD